MKRYVLGFLFSEDRSEVVLIKKRKPTWQAGLLNGVGGKIEEGEDPIDAMRREFQEETGKWVPEWREFGLLLGKTFRLYLFRAEGDVEGVETKTDEQIYVVRWLDYRLWPHVSNLKWLIPMAKQNDVYFTGHDLSHLPENSATPEN